jgi:hypothetical protein
MMVAPEPRVVTIEGRKVLITERRPPLPPSLQLLLEGGRDATGRYWAPLRVLKRRPLQFAGARSACLAEDHRLIDWLDGFHVGSDGFTRSLHLAACEDCGSVCVRDASFDTLERLDPQGRGEALSVRRPPRRKDHVIGWYSGARPANREYR